MSTTTHRSKKEKSSTPELRFKDYKDEWIFKQLNDLLEFKNGVNADKEQYGRGIKFINVLDILSNDFLIYEVIIGSVDIDEETFRKNIVSFGDILFQRSSETREEVGTACVYLDNKPATFGGFVIRGKKIGDYDPIFFNKLLKTNLARNEITSKSGGSTRYNVGQETLSSVSLPFPSLPEQQKIASFLSAVDEKIQQLTRKKELLEQYKKGVMQQLFSGKLRFKDKNGKLYPKWEEKLLGDIIEVGSSKRVLQEDWKDEGVPFLRTREIISLSIGEEFRTPIFISEQLFADLKEKYGIPKAGDVLATGVGTIGEVYVVKKEDRFYFKDGNVIWFKMNGSLDSNFIAQLFKTRYIRKQLLDNASITTVATFTIDGARKTKIICPCIEEQHKVASFLMGLDAKIESVATQIIHTQTFKKGLLQQMFV